MKLLSEFGRGKDLKKRIKRQNSYVRNIITQTPGKSTTRASNIGGTIGLGAGLLWSGHALHRARNVPNNLTGVIGKSIAVAPLLTGITTLGALSGIAYNSKIRKKSLYE